MEPILVYGHPAGSSTGLIAALEWLGRPYRLARVDMLGEMRHPSFLRINRRVETPVFVASEGHVLTETMAIAAHLEERDEERRISFEPRSAEADRMRQLMAFVNTGFTASFGPLWTALEMDPPDPETQDVLRRVGRSAVLERHDRLEEMLSSEGFATGNRPTLADAVLTGVARWLDIHEVADRGRWPKLAAWRKRIEADDAVRFAEAVEREGAAAGGGSGALLGHVPLGEVIERFGEA